MKLEFKNRAVDDLRKIASRSHEEFGDRVAAALEVRIRHVINGNAERPESAPRLEHREDLRVIQLGKYPFKIFYRVLPDRIRILHVRHSARRPPTVDRDRVATNIFAEMELI